MTTEPKNTPPLGRVIVVTSGKGGVGKTTSSAAISAGLAKQGFKTVVIDFDVGLRNLDMTMGCERRVVFDFINVIQGDKDGTLDWRYNIKLLEEKFPQMSLNLVSDAGHHMVNERQDLREQIFAAIKL